MEEETKKPLNTEKEKKFNSPSKGKLNLDKVIEEIGAYIGKEPDKNYNLVIGTDANGSAVADFISAIIVHRVGFGGIYFWRKAERRKVYSLRDKIYKEVNISLELTQEFILKFKNSFSEKKLENYNFEIHVDVGNGGQTREMIKEVVGMVRGNGFEVRTKPDAYGASKIADKYT